MASRFNLSTIPAVLVALAVPGCSAATRSDSGPSTTAGGGQGPTSGGNTTTSGTDAGGTEGGGTGHSDGGDGDTGDGDGETQAGGTEETTGGGGGETRLDVGGGSGGDTPPGECIQCALTIASKQSGVLEVVGGGVFATAELMGETVYALGNLGAGRFIATADSSLPFNEDSDCPILSWLSNTEDPVPRILHVGYTRFDGPVPVPIAMRREGVHLPAEYLGQPERLADDFDIVWYSEASGQWDMGDEPTDEEMQTYVDYVALHGGGLYVSSEYADPSINAYLRPQDIDSVNRLLLPLGLETVVRSLDWGDVDGEIDFSCFPPPVG